MTRSDGTEFGGDDHRQRGLPQPGRAGQQDVIRCAAAVLGALEHQLQLLAHPLLADELLSVRGRRLASISPSPTVSAGETSRVLDVSGPSSEPAHHVLTQQVTAPRRSALEVVASGSSASTLSVASSACFAAKPSPTRASTTRIRTACPPAPANRAGAEADRADLVAQFQHHPLGTAFADAGHPGQRGDVAVGERLPQRVGVVTASVASAILRPDTGDAEQRAEQIPRFAVGEAVQRHRVLADDHRGDQPGLVAAPQRGQRRRVAITL